MVGVDEMPVPAFRLYGVTGAELVAGGTALDDWLAVLCWHGLRGVQLRERALDDEALYRLAMLCRPIFERHHIEWLVNGSVAVAQRAEATGVHLRDGQDVAAARAALGPDRLIGQSVHSRDGAVAAAKAGADFVVLGPVFDTASKPGAAPLGLDALRAACAACPVPVYAIGGMTPTRAEACVAAGARGAAVMSGLMAAPAADEALAKYEHALGGL